MLLDLNNIVTTKEDFFKKHGEYKQNEINWVLQLCTMTQMKLGPSKKSFDPNALIGVNYSLGLNSYSEQDDYFAAVDNWADLDMAVSHARNIENIMKDLYHSSSIDAHFYAFVIPAKYPQEELSEHVNNSHDFSVVESPDNLPGFSVEDVENREYVFFDYEPEKPEDYHSTEELGAYKQASEYMMQHLTNLRELELQMEYVLHPAFWLGQTKAGYWTGVVTIRKDV